MTLFGEKTREQPSKKFSWAVAVNGGAKRLSIRMRPHQIPVTVEMWWTSWKMEKTGARENNKTGRGKGFNIKKGEKTILKAALEQRAKVTNSCGVRGISGPKPGCWTICLSLSLKPESTDVDNCSHLCRKLTIVQLCIQSKVRAMQMQVRTGPRAGERARHSFYVALPHRCPTAPWGRHWHGMVRLCRPGFSAGGCLVITLLLQCWCFEAWRRAHAHITMYVVLPCSCHSTWIGCISKVTLLLIFQLSLTLQMGSPSRSVTSVSILCLFIFKLCIFLLVTLHWGSVVFVFVSPGIRPFCFFIFSPPSFQLSTVLL